ncbi:MAG: ribokinase [Bacillota bacterium]|nr:ribokinase [Bacillota bacterium]
MLPIYVVGSLNTDLTVTVPKFHLPGETIIGTSFQIFLGGKGGNQAVAAARLKADVRFVGALGQDAYGDAYLKGLQDEGVNTQMIVRRADQPSGIALIEVNPAGENRIIVVSGANRTVDENLVKDSCCKVTEKHVLMLQLEIPMKANIEAAKHARVTGSTVILDPAPAAPLPPELIENVDFITPNETELAMLTGMKTDTMEEVKAAALSLINLGAKRVVAKLGKRGNLYVDREKSIFSPGFKVNAIDTTAAGDSFNAGLAYAVSRGMGLEEGLRLANAVGALSTTAMGAQAAMPSIKEVEELLIAQST